MVCTKFLVDVDASAQEPCLKQEFFNSVNGSTTRYVTIQIPSGWKGQWSSGMGYRVAKSLSVEIWSHNPSSQFRERCGDQGGLIEAIDAAMIERLGYFKKIQQDLSNEIAAVKELLKAEIVCESDPLGLGCINPKVFKYLGIAFNGSSFSVSKRVFDILKVYGPVRIYDANTYTSNCGGLLAAIASYLSKVLTFCEGRLKNHVQSLDQETVRRLEGNSIAWGERG